jgi:hypothetical protein
MPPRNRLAVAGFIAPRSLSAKCDQATALPGCWSIAAPTIKRRHDNDRIDGLIARVSLFNRFHHRQLRDVPGGLTDQGRPIFARQGRFDAVVVPKGIEPHFIRLAHGSAGNGADSQHFIVADLQHSALAHQLRAQIAVDVAPPSSLDFKFF